MIQKKLRKEQRRDQRARDARHRENIESTPELHHSAPLPSVCSSLVVCLKRGSVFAMCLQCVAVCFQSASECLQCVCSLCLQCVFAVCLQCVWVCLQCVFSVSKRSAVCLQCAELICSFSWSVAPPLCPPIARSISLLKSVYYVLLFVFLACAWNIWMNNATCAWNISMNNATHMHQSCHTCMHPYPRIWCVGCNCMLSIYFACANVGVYIWQKKMDEVGKKGVKTRFFEAVKQSMRRMRQVAQRGLSVLLCRRHDTSVLRTWLTAAPLLCSFVGICIYMYIYMYIHEYI